jgi:hypothetical protein
MKKMPCDIYSRVTGYYRPLRLWNPGKKSEFNERYAEKQTQRMRLNLRRKSKKIIHKSLRATASPHDPDF